MSLFDLRMENRGAQDVPGTLITEGDEGQSVAAAIQEATLEERGFEDAEAEAEAVAEGTDTVGDTIEAVDEAMRMESQGMSPTGAALVRSLMSNVAGREYTQKKVSARFEGHSARATRRESTSFTMLGLRDTLKGLWEKVKATVEKVLNRARSWMISNFSTAKRIAAKAEKVRDRANEMTGTIDKKTFSFSQTARLAVDGKLRDVGAFEKALDELNEIGKLTINAMSNNQLDKALESLDGTDDDDLSSQRIEFPNLPFVEAGSNVDKEVKDRYGDDKKLLVSGILPGDVIAAFVDTKDSSKPNYRVVRFDFINPKKNPKKVEAGAEVVTLSTSQITTLCDKVSDGAGHIVDYEKSFANRERFLKERIKHIDDSVKERINELKDGDGEGQAAKERSIVDAGRHAIECIKRTEGVAPKVSGVSTAVYAAVLNWCEGSMANYK